VVVSNIQLRVNSTQAVKALNSANVAAKKLNATLQKSQGAMKSTQGTMRGMASAGFGAAKGMGAAAVSVKGLGAAFKAALGPLGLAISTIGALTAGVRGFVEADKARAAVRTLGVDAEALEGQLVGVVARTKGLASSNQLLAASYDVASAGFSKAADISKILEASTFGAVGGMTDIATVSDAATSVMNAFGLTTDSVAKIVDGFIQTQNDGKIVVGQYASQIGRVAPIAAAAGVGVDELNAAISTVTAQGVPVESTFSGINQVIASVVKPTAEAAKAAKRLGLDFSSAAIKTKGFGGFLEDLIAKTGGSEVEITKLFGSVDALKALMPLINDDLVRFNKNLENQQNATGAAEAAADIMGETVSSQISKILNSLSTLVRGLDQVLGPAIKGILSLVNSVITAAVRATDALGKMFRMNRARTEARIKLGGTIGRGTTKGKATPEAVEALALADVAAAEAASAATKPPTVDVPVNGIIPTGGLTDNAGGRGKTDAERAAELLARQKESANQLLVTLKQKGELEAASTDAQRRELALQHEKTNLATRFPLLKEKELEALRDQLDKNYGITEEKRKQKELDDAAAKAAAATAEKYKKLGDAIKSNVTDAIMGAIDGTKSLGESALGILKDLGKQFLQLGINQAFGALGGGGGILGMLFGGGKAKGGTVQGGRSYMVGERGPELFTPGRTGSIAPNKALGGDMSVVVNVDASGTEVQGNQGNADQLGRLIGAAVQAELIKQKRPGGLLTR
jgi:TP901 family phage tail tape measure protein|tara:strand:- start:99 stop:2330 length:2232 start_codon:yes stop_codon:yes gene_type:complete